MTVFKSTVLSLFVGSIVMFSGCRTAVVIAPGPHCADDPVEVCHDYQDWHGHIHRECRTEIHHHCWMAAKSLGNPVGAVGLGNDFGVGYDAAQKLIDMAVAANKGDAGPALAVGFSTTDLAAMAKGEEPSKEGIETVAKNLDQDPAAMGRLFTVVLEETRQNKAAAAKK